MKGRQVQDALSGSNQHFPLWHHIGINVHFMKVVLEERAGRDGDNLSVHWNKKYFLQCGTFYNPFFIAGPHYHTFNLQTTNIEK